MKRHIYVAVAFPAELAHDGQIALVGADDHAAAEKVKNGPLRRLRPFPNDQARKTVHLDRFVIRLMIPRRKNAAAPVLLFDDLQDFLLRQPKRLFRAGKLIGRAQRGSKNAHSPCLLSLHNTFHQLRPLRRIARQQLLMPQILLVEDRMGEVPLIAGAVFRAHFQGVKDMDFRTGNGDFFPAAA